MSKRKNTQKSVADFFPPKKKAGDDGDGNLGDSESDFGSSNDPMPSKHNHNVQFDLKMERVECANGNDLFFDFFFHLSGTSSNRINIEHGERELVPDSTPNLRVHIEGTARENVELHVRIDDNRKHERKYKMA